MTKTKQLKEEILTIREAERWLEKLEKLTSRGAKLVYLKILLQTTITSVLKECVGEDEKIDAKKISGDPFKRIRNQLRAEIRKKLKERGVEM